MKINKTTFQKWGTVLILMALFILTSCEPKVEPPKPPLIEPAGEITVDPGDTITIRANTTEAQEYKWDLQGEGQVSATTGDAILYTAPQQGGGKSIVTVSAHNVGGKSPTTSLVIDIAKMQVVRVDALAIPAGFMSGGGSPSNFIEYGTASSDCQSGTDCIQITYEPGGGWGGIIWWPMSCGSSGTPDAWEKVKSGSCGIDIVKENDLSSIHELTFWAKGEKGNEVIEFKVGASDILPRPGRSSGKVSLTPAWKQYRIEISKLDLTNAIGLFMWVAADDTNRTGAVFYLDDIQFEGMR